MPLHLTTAAIIRASGASGGGGGVGPGVEEGGEVRVAEGGACLVLGVVCLCFLGGRGCGRCCFGRFD